MEKIIKSLEYVPKIWTALSYLVILVFSMFLFFGRNMERIRIGLLLGKFPDFYTHVSNFSLTLMVFITIGYIGLMMGVTLKHVAIIGILLSLVNLVFEFFISFLNTPDKIDAVYGIFGVLLGLVFLYIAKRNGLIKNELYHQME